jgi:hypothetical protein
MYIRLLSDLSPGNVRAKIAGELYVWTYDELRAIIGT